MELTKYKEVYSNYSKQTSDITRQLALAGIAIIWIFKIGSSNQTTPTHLIPIELVKPLATLVISLALDLTQYFLLTVIWWIFFRYYEKKYRGNMTTDIKAPTWMPSIGWIFFFAKFFALIIAYIEIIRFLFGKL